MIKIVIHTEVQQAPHPSFVHSLKINLLGCKIASKFNLGKVVCLRYQKFRKCHLPVVSGLSQRWVGLEPKVGRVLPTLGS